jgi:hypothetical protein
MSKRTKNGKRGITYRMMPKRLVDLYCSTEVSPPVETTIGSDENLIWPPGAGFDLDPDDEHVGPLPRSGRQAAITAVVGATFEAAVPPELRRKLTRSEAMCVILQVPSQAWVRPVSVYFGSVFGDHWRQRVPEATKRRAHDASDGSSEVSLALATGHCVVGVCADVRLLPRTLVAAADFTIRLRPPTGAVIRTAIIRFAKRNPQDVDERIVAGLELTDILSAFRPGTGPQRIVDRLMAARDILDRWDPNEDNEPEVQP